MSHSDESYYTESENVLVAVYFSMYADVCNSDDAAYLHWTLCIGSRSLH